jgi:hypothetical protein
MAKINSFEDDKSFLDQDYSDLSSRYGILDGSQSFVNSDGSVNTTFVTQRKDELLTLLSERDKLLATMDEEQAELNRGIAVLRALIARLLAQLKAERARVEKDNQALSRLTKMINAESAKKKPDAKKLAGWRSQVSKTTADRSGATRNISSITSAVNDHNSLLATWTHDARFQPLDRYGVQTDVLDLTQQLGALGTSASIIAQYGGGVSAGAGASPVDVSALLSQIARLTQALDIQGAQQAVLGSFQKGTLHVPATGVYALHAGEAVTPAAVARGDSGSSRPVEVHLHVDDAMSWLKPYIRAEAVNASDAISVKIGQKATERARSGRY